MRNSLYDSNVKLLVAERKKIEMVILQTWSLAGICCCRSPAGVYLQPWSRQVVAFVKLRRDPIVVAGERPTRQRSCCLETEEEEARETKIIGSALDPLLDVHFDIACWLDRVHESIYERCSSHGPYSPT